MELYSKEYLDKLIAKHRLLSAAIAHISSNSDGSEYNRYANNYGVDSVAAAAREMFITKVGLEAQIDVLREYLN